MSHKDFPPSQSRINAAGKSGIFIPLTLLSTGVIFLIGSAFLYLISYSDSGNSIGFQYFTNLFKTSIDSQSNFYLFIHREINSLLFVAFILSLVIFALTAIPFFIVVKKIRQKGSTAVPLPKKVDDNGLVFVMGLTGTLLVILTGGAILFNGSFNFQDFLINPGVAVQNILTLISKLLFAASMIAIFLGIMQISLFKIKLIKELSLTKAEAHKESILHGDTGKRR
ncbi:MAG: EscU/YscU/HrcU family type III secretion system export apparatus switch protein [Deltaproteobacteria bacterium]|nr:EscU/YscU/HrcU family type III secretion system export apparatus switch protein [Deltaproteobacteria bacterium]